jgi:hypothetical protein
MGRPWVNTCAVGGICPLAFSVKGTHRAETPGYSKLPTSNLRSERSNKRRGVLMSSKSKRGLWFIRNPERVGRCDE